MYDLRNPLDRDRFKRRCNALYKKQGIVDLSEKGQRSSQQNRYLHLLLGYLAIETSNTLEYVKEVFYKRSANKELYLREKEDAILGKVEYLRSSAELTKEEMTLSIDKLRDWASQTAEIYLPSANEHEFLASIEYEMSRMKQWI
jgi:hypothetical protein